MIIRPPHAIEDSEPPQSTVDLLNSYLQVLKRKFVLLGQIMQYFSLGEVQHRNEQFYALFEQLKKEEKALMMRLHGLKESSCIDKRTFERFCLRIYEQFEVATQKLKKIKLPCVVVTELTTSLQGILFESKPQSSSVNVGDFLLKVISCEETFKLHSIKKLHNFIKKTDAVMAEECKLLFKQELALKIAYDQEYEIAEMTGGHYDNNWYRGARQSMPAVSADAPPSIEPQTLEHALTSNRVVFRKKATVILDQIVPRPPLLSLQKKPKYPIVVQQPPAKLCQHCQCLKLLEIANMEQFSHQHLGEMVHEKEVDKLMLLNQRNHKEIEHFRKVARRAARAQLRSQQRVDHHQPRSLRKNQEELPSPVPSLPPPSTPAEYEISTDNRPTSISISRKRANGTRSVMFNKESVSTTEDQKTGQSLKKMTEKLKRPSLAKLAEKKQQLQFLRDAVNHNNFHSFNGSGSESNDKSREHEPDEVFRPREILALPRISRK